MAVQTAQTEFQFLKPDYYPPCLPECIRYNLTGSGYILYQQDLVALVDGWHLNESCALVAEALHGYPAEQRTFLAGALASIVGDRNYFEALRGYMKEFLEQVGDTLLAVDVRGKRLTYSNLIGCAFLDREYAKAAAEWKKVGRIVCFLTYPSLVYLPRVLDAYRESERQILLGLHMVGLPANYYCIIPERSRVSGMGEGEYILRGERLMEAGASFVPVPEQ